MKLLKNLSLILVTLLVSCGSTERVITADGSIYEVKGNKIMNAGADVSETLTDEQKASINQLMKEQQKAAAEAKQLQKELDDKQARLETARKEADKKRTELEEKQEALKEKLEAKEDASSKYVKAKARLADKLNKYKRLKDKGKLSPRDEEKWQEKLKDYEDDIADAKREMDELNKQ